MSLLFRASARHLLHHRSQCLLAVTGIALGVAIVISIQITQLSARTAFAQSLESIFGRATHQISAIDGDFDEARLATIRIAVPHWHPTPVVDTQVEFDRDGERHSLPVIGIDPLTGPALGTGNGAGLDLTRLMRQPGSALISSHTATRLGLRSGQSVRVQGPRGASELEIIEVFDTRVIVDALVVDIATAQELAGRPFRLSRIELQRPGEANDEISEPGLLRALGPTLRLTDRRQNLASAEQLTHAFYTNLDALGMLALLVGAFMIYNTMTFLVVQRQTLYARLRALGVSRNAIGGQILTEALLLGAIGGCVGNAIGYGLAQLLSEPVAQTVSDHYIGAAHSAVVASPGLLLLGMLLAIVSAVCAAILPAWQATRLEPAQIVRLSVQESESQSVLSYAAAIGVLSALLGMVLLAMTTHSLYAGFAALGCLVVAATLLTPRLVQLMLNAIERNLAARLPLPERLAAKNATRSMARIGLAIAALMAATATSVGVGLMVGSFRTAVDDWLQQLMRADLYVSQNFERRDQAAIDNTLITQVLANPRVASVSRVARVYIDNDGVETRVTAYDLPPAARAGFRFIDGDIDAIWENWKQPGHVIVSEPFAWHQRLEVGDRYRLPTPNGIVPMTVMGVYTDYGSERGVVAISWENYHRYWGKNLAHSIGIYAANHVALDALENDLRRQLQAEEHLTVWPNAQLRARSLAIFDRTFVVTDVLTLLAALIAALGVFNALLALNLERAHEYAVLRAVGWRRALVRRYLYAQTLIVTALALLIALPVGALIAVLLIEIINVRSFGWSMDFSWNNSALVLPCLLALLGAAAATVLPAEQAVRADPARALRYE